MNDDKNYVPCTRWPVCVYVTLEKIDKSASASLRMSLMGSRRRRRCRRRCGTF